MKGFRREPAFVVKSVRPIEVAHLFDAHHAYKSSGRVSTYAFAVVENGRAIAAFLWQPPPPGAAKSVCPELPQGVLALSRMVAVPKGERRLKHVSKPLRQQMLKLIDRTRWPVLVTYSDESVGHTGHVYKCSGWTATVRNLAKTFTVNGKRVSAYANGKMAKRGKDDGAVGGSAWIQRWEHRIARPKEAFEEKWERVAIPGKKWASGAQAYKYERKVA